MKSNASVGLLCASLWAGLAPPLSAQVVSRPPELRLEDVVDSLAGPEGRVVMGDVEYRIGADPQAKGGVGVMVRTWPDGVVPYVLDQCLRPDQVGLAELAMRRWEEVAPVRFTPGNGVGGVAAPQSGRTTWPECGSSRPPSQNGVTYANYVRIAHSPNSNSSCVGMCGGEQVLRFTEEVPVGVVLHELGHVLGMSHEHVRSDRDRYVRVLSNNIDSQFLHNFRVVRTENCTAYDFGSIMHYGQAFFSTNGQATLLPHSEYLGFADLMGRRVELTESDIRDVRSAYGAETCTPPGSGPAAGPATAAPTTVGPSPRIVDLELTGSVGHQRVVFSADFNVDALREGWSQGLDLVTGAEGPGGQVIVMARGRERSVQHISYNTSEWPGDFVSQYWNDPDHVIKGVFGGPAGWSLIMNRVESVYVPSAGQSLENWGWHAQSWRLRARWPEGVVRELWDEGKDITDIAYGPGGWMLVFSQETHWGAQGWDRTDDLPAKIRERWDDGFSITDIAFGEGLWHLVATKNVGVGEQRWVRSETFPEQEIRRAWDDGMHIEALDYGAGLWYVVFSERR